MGNGDEGRRGRSGRVGGRRGFGGGVPALALEGGGFEFGGVGAGLPEGLVAGLVGHELLTDEVAGVVVGVFVVVAVADFFHEACGGVAQVEGHG